jgi:ABC-type uncharacterized transport system auxiliary subunit
MTGCTSPTPAMQEYRLSETLPAFQAIQTECHSKTLKVQPAMSDSLYKSSKMYYAQGKYAQYSYSQSRWIENPNSKITKKVTRYLRKMKLFKSVQNAESKTKNDLSLEITIEDFLQYFDENDKNSYVNVVITFSFVNLRTHKIYATKTFQSKLKTQTNDALGGVKALDKGLYNVLKESGLWMKGICFDK